MFEISNFFKKIQNSFSKEVVFRTEIKKTIKEYVGIDIDIENISCKNGIINLKNINQTALSAVFIKKTKILETLRQFYKREYIKDII